MGQINNLVKLAHEDAVRKGFYDESLDIHRSINLIHDELSEAVRELRNGRVCHEIYYGMDGKPEGFPVEIADTVIRCFDLIGALGITNFEEIILEKMQYNASDARPRKNGKKF